MRKPKIVVASPMNFLAKQKARLEKLGETTIYDDLPNTPEEWLNRTKNSKIICSGKYGLSEKIYENKNVFYSLPFVAVGWVDKDKLKQSGNVVSYCPGCNSFAVSEWIVSMALLQLRKFNRLINLGFLENKTGSPDYLGLAQKRACVLGKGNVGSKVGEILKSLGMEVVYFGRGDSLFEKTRDCSLVVNSLSQNETTNGLLNRKFFNSFMGETFFITVTSSKIYDSEAMLSALKTGKLLGVADDCGSVLPGNYEDPYYKKISKIPNVLATPHISYQSDVTTRVSNDMMIDNIEAWIKGKPINLLK